MSLRRSARERPTDELPVTSRALHGLDQLTARPATSVVVAVALVAALVGIVSSGFDPALEAEFATVCSAITVTMVFVLQHTQRRAQLATQLKLDEIIAALPDADDRVVHVESSGDAELGELIAARQAHHAALRSDG